MLSGTAGKISTGELLRRAVAAAPVANAALNASAVEEANTRARAAEAASAAAKSASVGGASETAPASDSDASRVLRGVRLRARAAARRRGDGSRRDGYGDGEDDVDADGDPATVDPGMLPKRTLDALDAFFLGNFRVPRDGHPDAHPSDLPGDVLGVLAQMLKMRLCGPDVIAPAECQTTFDITGHQVVSVSLGFLLVFRTDWAYDRYYEGKQSLGHLYGGLRNLNVLFRDVPPREPPGREGGVRGEGRTRRSRGRRGDLGGLAQPSAAREFQEASVKSERTASSS